MLTMPKIILPESYLHAPNHKADITSTRLLNTTTIHLWLLLLILLLLLLLLLVL